MCLDIQKLFDLINKKRIEKKKQEELSETFKDFDFDSLVTALHIKSKELHEVYCSYRQFEINDTITIDDILTIRISARNNNTSYDIAICFFIENIATETCWISSLNKDFMCTGYREWQLFKTTIEYKLPPCFIKTINNWSKQVIEEYKKECKKQEELREQKRLQREKENSKRKQQELEILAKYY